MNDEGQPEKTPGKVDAKFILKHCPVEVRGKEWPPLFARHVPKSHCMDLFH